MPCAAVAAQNLFLIRVNPIFYPCNPWLNPLKKPHQAQPTSGHASKLVPKAGKVFTKKTKFKFLYTLTAFYATLALEYI